MKLVDSRLWYHSNIHWGNRPFPKSVDYVLMVLMVLACFYHENVFWWINLTWPSQLVGMTGSDSLKLFWVSFLMEIMFCLICAIRFLFWLNPFDGFVVASYIVKIIVLSYWWDTVDLSKK